MRGGSGSCRRTRAGCGWLQRRWYGPPSGISKPQTGSRPGFRAPFGPVKERSPERFALRSRERSDLRRPLRRGTKAGAWSVRGFATIPARRGVHEATAEDRSGRVGRGGRVEGRRDREPALPLGSRPSREIGYSRAAPGSRAAVPLAAAFVSEKPRFRRARERARIEPERPVRLALPAYPGTRTDAIRRHQVMERHGSQRSEHASRDDSLRRLVRVLARTGTEADDLAQEVWLSALRKPQASAQPEWFRVVARRTQWRWSRREHARAARERLVARPEAHEGGSGQLEAESLREYLSASVDALKDPYREVVRLHYFDDLSVDEIVDRVGRPAVTVRVQLKRGLEQLRARLEGRRGRFLGWIPVLAGSSWLPGWARRANVRALALGAGAVALAVVLLAVVPGSGRGRGARSVDPDHAGETGAALATHLESASSVRLPGELGAPPERTVPEPASILVGGRVLGFDGTPIAGAPVFLRDR